MSQLFILFTDWGGGVDEIASKKHFLEASLKFGSQLSS